MTGHVSAVCVCMCACVDAVVRLSSFVLTAPFNNHTIDEEGLSVPIFPWLLWPANQSVHMRDAANHEVNINQTVEPSDQVRNNYNYLRLEQ